MFVSRAWQSAALILNLIGTFVVFFSFQATSSNIKIVTDPIKHETSLCVDNKAIMTAIPGGGVGIGGKICPAWEQARPAAVVNTERPGFVTVGFLLIAAGFFLQILALRPAKKKVPIFIPGSKAEKRHVKRQN